MTDFQMVSRIWSLLVCAAGQKRTYTYKGVAEAIGRPTAWRLGGGRWLEPIMRYCQQNDLPPLTVLVVKKKTGKPGSGLEGVPDPGKARCDVFCFDWSVQEPPDTEDFKEAVR